MNNKKQKQGEGAKPKKSTLVVQPIRTTPESSFDADPHFWDKEIEAVKHATYESVEAAIDAIAERVVQRMASSTIDERETKRFVAELLSSNEEVVATLRSVLDIR